MNQREPTELDIRAIKADIGVQLEEIMSKECSKYECILADENDIGLLWTFLLEDSISGFIGIEDNEDGIGVETVTTGIHLKDISDIDSSGLMHILELNSELINANFTVAHVTEKNGGEPEPVYAEEGESIEFDEGEENTVTRDILLIQCRIPLSTFDPNDFSAIIQNLMIQSDMALRQNDGNESNEPEI